MRAPWVSIAHNTDYRLDTVSSTVRRLVDTFDVSVTAPIKTGSSVLVKVNMGCSGQRHPDDRVTTHPALAAAVIKWLIDCGATVSFGDDVSRVGRYCEKIWSSTGMLEVARKTGAKLIDFTGAGARNVRGGLLYPRTYLITNSYFEADVVVNLANCRSHASIGLSGAIKNMFGCVVGRRKLRIHQLFGHDTRHFAKAIVDIHRTIPAHISFLDLTSFRDGYERLDSPRDVGVLMAGPDPVALDAIASHIVGYEHLPLLLLTEGVAMGLGTADLDAITTRGLEWNSFITKMRPPAMQNEPAKENLYESMGRVVNNTWLRARPAIDAEKCNKCGLCLTRCPVKCIALDKSGVPIIDLASCADCACCIAVCENGAVTLEHRGIASIVRRVAKHPTMSLLQVPARRSE